MEIDVSSARWHCHTVWLEWTHAMDVYVLLSIIVQDQTDSARIKKWKAYTVIIYEMSTTIGNLSTTTVTSTNNVDVRGAVVIRQIQERVDHAAPGFEDILITAKHLEDLEAWIKLAKDAVQDSLASASD